MAQQQAAGTGRRLRRYGLVAFIGFFLMIGAWSLAAPYDGTPDEQQHIIRAAGVVAGQIAPAPAAAVHGSGAFQQVPEGLVRDNCWRFKTEVSAACATPPSANRTIVTAPTGAGRYNPIFYLVVGGPLRLWPGMVGVLLARLIGAAASAALLAGAVVSILRWSRLRLMAAGLVAAVTPMVLQMTSAVNPNGVEIAAGVALFASGIPLLVDRRLGRGAGGPDGRPAVGAGPHDRALLWQVAISAAILTTLRSTGPLWLATAAVALLLPFGWGRVRALVADRWLRPLLAVALLFTLAGCAWTVLQKASDLGDYRPDHPFSAIQAAFGVQQYWREYTDELVGVMSWLDLKLPLTTYLIWESLVAALILGAVVWGTRRDRWRMAVLAAGGVVLPSLIQVAAINKTGWVTQGRYMLPVLVGLPLFAGWVIERNGLSAEKARFITRGMVLVLFPLQLAALWYTMLRWQQGVYGVFPGGHGLNPLAGDWHPVVGSATPLLVEVAGLLVIGTLVWKAAGWRAPDALSPSVEADGATPRPAQVSDAARSSTAVVGAI
jgi:Predicted membrane protein (DUF2142)